ncbi:unnamed protein product [Scytosiphon promiscuus]
MEVLQEVLTHLLANATTMAVVGVLYFNFVLWREYLITLLWAFIISVALYSPKARLIRAISTLSKEDARPMVFAMWDFLAEPFRRMHAEGRPVHEMVFISTLDWCIESFALVGFMFITSRLSMELLVATSFVTLLSYGFLYAVDRRVFAYRRVISDNTLACTILIVTFFASVSFIVLFLGLESFFEGMTAWQGVSEWVKSMLDGENDGNEWSENVARAAEFIQEKAGGFVSQYNETVWYPMARDAIFNYMEHGTLTTPPETCMDEPAGATGGILGAVGGFSGLVGQFSSLNFSMEHVVDYGAPSGKVFATGLALLASLCSSLIMVGFKVVLFFTCVFFMTSNDDFLERNMGDFLPISRMDQKSAMATLRGAIEGVFFLPCKVACLRGVVTLFSFKILQIEFPFFAAFLAVLVSILPIVPAYIVCWPWALTLVLRGRWVGIALAVSQHLILSVIDTELYTQGVREANPYLTSLSSFLGYAVFGAQGVLLGPLAMCLATLIYGGLGFLERSVIQDGMYKASLENERARLDTPPIPHQSDSGKASQACGTVAGLCAKKEEEELPGSGNGAGVSRDASLTSHVGSESPGGKAIADVHKLAELLSTFSCDLQNGPPRCKRRVTLKTARHPPSVAQDDDEVESLHQTWRLHLSPNLNWKAFVEEVQDVLGVPGISGVYGSDGAKITRIDFIENGETLLVVPENTKGLV